MQDNQGVPEIYADVAQIAVSNVGIFLGFRAINPVRLLSQEAINPETQQTVPAELKAVVRLTPTDAKILAIMLKRALKGYEQDSGEIPLPPEFAPTVNLGDDEW